MPLNKPKFRFLPRQEPYKKPKISWDGKSMDYNYQCDVCLKRVNEYKKTCPNCGTPNPEISEKFFTKSRITKYEDD